MFLQKKYSRASSIFSKALNPMIFKSFITLAKFSLFQLRAGNSILDPHLTIALGRVKDILNITSTDLKVYLHLLDLQFTIYILYWHSSDIVLTLNSDLPEFNAEYLYVKTTCNWGDYNQTVRYTKCPSAFLVVLKLCFVLSA